MPIDPEFIAAWKAQYGEVFSVGDEFVFRALTVKEHKELYKHSDWSSADIEDNIVEAAVLYPDSQKLDRLPAGVVSQLATEILNVSGYGEASFAKKKLDEARVKADEVINIVKIFIIAAIPSYSDEDLDNYTFSELILKVALAEKIFEVHHAGVPKFELVDPEEVAAEQKRQMAKELATKKPGQSISTDPIAQKLRSALG